jgi:hypothetical protein
MGLHYNPFQIDLLRDEEEKASDAQLQRGITSAVEILISRHVTAGSQRDAAPEFAMDANLVIADGDRTMVIGPTILLSNNYIYFCLGPTYEYIIPDAASNQ